MRYCLQTACNSNASCRLESSVTMGKMHSGQFTRESLEMI